MPDQLPVFSDIDQALSAPHPSAATSPPIQHPVLSDIDEALSGTAQPPGMSFSVAPSQSSSAPPIGAAAQMGESLSDALAAGAQGTSPIVRAATGDQNYQPASEADQWVFRETGVPRDQQTQVALRDPQSGEYRVYQRNPEMAEGNATPWYDIKSHFAPFGRALAYGTPESGIPAVATPRAASAPQALLQDFERSGVAPNIPAVGQGIGSRLAANVVSKVPVFGQPIATGTRNMMQQTGASADTLASGLGTAENAEEAGRAAQSGINQFAKGPIPMVPSRAGPGSATTVTLGGKTTTTYTGGWRSPVPMSAADIIASPTKASSFAAKSGALYDRFWSQMDPNAQIPLTNTLAALKGPADRFPTIPPLGQQITNPKLQSLFQTVAPKTTTTAPVFSSLLNQSGNPMLIQAAQKIQSGGSLTVPELQEFRSFIGRALGEPTLVNDIPRADLSRVYGGMSQDLEDAAAAQTAYNKTVALGAGMKPADPLASWQAANSYYSAGKARIDQLEPLLNGSPEQSFAAINRAAGQGPAANAGLLRSLQRSLPDQDWGNVGAAVLRKMGAPTPGATDVLHGSDFSPASFVTNWSKLSDAAKDTLFGAQGTAGRDNIEALTRVAGAQKNVTKFANPSGTASHVIGASALAGIWENHEALLAHPIATALSALGGYGASKLLMSPAAARWLYTMPSTINRAPTASAGIERALGGLDVLARGDSGLAPLASQMRGAFGPLAPAQTGQPQSAQPPTR